MSHLKENAPKDTTLHYSAQWEREQRMSPHHTGSTTEANRLGRGNVSPHTFILVK